MITDEEHIIICAVRYALGRMTYVVDIVCDYVESRSRELSENCVNIIVRDIEEEINKYHILGMMCVWNVTNRGGFGF